MKVNVEEISTVKKKVHVEIPEEDVLKEIDTFYQDLKRRQRLKGFVRGRFPGISWSGTSRTMSRWRSFRN